MQAQQASLLLLLLLAGISYHTMYQPINNEQQKLEQLQGCQLETFNRCIQLNELYQQQGSKKSLTFQAKTLNIKANQCAMEMTNNFRIDVCQNLVANTGRIAQNIAQYTQNNEIGQLDSEFSELNEVCQAYIPYC